LNRKLDEAQELALKTYINTLDEMIIPPRPKQIVKSVNEILYADHTDPKTPPPKVDMRWLKRWLDRNPEYRRRKIRAIELDRQQAHEPKVIQEWYDRLECVIQEKGIAVEDIWNFDETGFRIGIGKDQWIITREKMKKLFTPSNTNTEYVTLVEAISAGGETIPPLIIMTGKVIMEGWFDYTEKGSFIGISESGYINDELAYRWIQQFHAATVKSKKGVYRLLLCDGYGSHITYEFIKFCEQNCIIIFFLIPHTSHILQPLDVAVFNVFKHWHSEAIADATQSGCGKFTKIEFLHALSEIRRRTFKKSTILAGFQLTGIVPWNPDIVITNLPEYQPCTPASEGSNETIWTWGSTPKTVSRFKTVGDRIPHLEGCDQMHNMKMLVKGAIAQAHLVEALSKEIYNSAAAQKAREQRSKASKRWIQTGGTVSSSGLSRIKKLKKNHDDMKERLKLRKIWRTVMTELIERAIDRGIIIKRPRLSRKIE
jgi:hypothetical protein